MENNTDCKNIEIDLEERNKYNDINVEVQENEKVILSNYNLLKNRPKINGIILEGDKSSEDLGIENYDDTELKEKVSNNSTEIKELKQKVGSGDLDGATFIPNVDAEGNISWTNNKGLVNPGTQNIKGPQGVQGEQGEPFRIKKTYVSIDDMQADFDNMQVGDYVMIATSVEVEDNAKLYAKTETEWVFITDFSGAQGIQGEQGPQGIQGIQGEKGTGISSLEVRDGSLYVTLTDNTQQNAGLIITDEVKQWIVNQVTENAKSDFNTYYDGKVTDFDNHVTVKINEFNTNATDKTNEFNQNAESLKNRIIELENQIPHGTVSGNNIHIKDSSNMELSVEKISGGYYQASEENSPSPDYPSEVETVGSNVNLCNGINQGYYLNFETYLCGLLSGNNGLIIPITGGKYTISTQINQTRYRVACINEKPIEGKTVTAYKGVNKDGTSNNITIDTSGYAYLIINATDLTKIKIEKGIVATPYSSYGMGSVEIDVANKNLLNIANTEETTKSGITYSIKNGILKLTGTATASFDIQLSKNIKIKKGKYTHSSSYIQSGLYVSFDNLGYLMISATAGKKRTFELTEDTTYKTYFIWIDKGTVLNNIEIKLQLEVAATATDFVEHQSQTITMPIQQEMLTGDYIDDVEHHEWGKLVLTGDEDWRSNWQNANISDYIQFYLTSSIFNNNFLAAQGICNIFGKALESVWNLKKEGYGINKDLRLSLQFKFLKTRFTTIEDFKAMLKSKYEAGTPVIIYYKLATPTNLELTAEQKAIREQKLYTYKTITNIAVSDELASVDISYKKDLDAMFDNIIKQMSSSTSDIAET